MAAKKKRKRRKVRSIIAIAAIFHCKGGFHKDKRNKRKKSDNLWKEDINE